MPGGGKSLRHVFRNTLPPNREEGEWGRRTDDVKRRAVVPRKWVDRVNAERGVEDGRRRGSVPKAGNLTGSSSSIW